MTSRSSNLHARGVATGIIAALSFAAVSASPAVAEAAKPAAEAAQPEAAHDHSMHGDMQAPAELSEASKAYDAVMQKMHKQMLITYTNDVDVDFVRGMIPHHQGAIEQAQVLLKYSKNPRLRRLAGGIIAAQRREIRFMQNWLKEHQKGVESGNMPNWLRSQPDPKGDGADLSQDDKP